MKLTRSPFLAHSLHPKHSGRIHCFPISFRLRLFSLRFRSKTKPVTNPPTPDEIFPVTLAPEYPVFAQICPGRAAGIG
jgi:hypothetical protein